MHGIMFWTVVGAVIKLTGDSLKQIAEQYRIQKYSSVSSVIERMKALIAADRRLRKRIEDLYSFLTKSQERKIKYFFYGRGVFSLDKPFNGWPLMAQIYPCRSHAPALSQEADARRALIQAQDFIPDQLIGIVAAWLDLEVDLTWIL